MEALDKTRPFDKVAFDFGCCFRMSGPGCQSLPSIRVLAGTCHLYLLKHFLIRNLAFDTYHDHAWPRCSLYLAHASPTHRVGERCDFRIFLALRRPQTETEAHEPQRHGDPPEPARPRTDARPMSQETEAHGRSKSRRGAGRADRDGEAG